MKNNIKTGEFLVFSHGIQDDYYTRPLFQALRDFSIDELVDELHVEKDGSINDYHSILKLMEEGYVQSLAFVDIEIPDHITNNVSVQDFPNGDIYFEADCDFDIEWE